MSFKERMNLELRTARRRQWLHCDQHGGLACRQKAEPHFVVLMSTGASWRCLCPAGVEEMRSQGAKVSTYHEAMENESK